MDTDDKHSGPLCVDMLLIATVAHLNRIRLANEYLEETRVAFLIFKRNELALENVLQLFLQGIVVLLSPTYTQHTATYSGLQSVFKEKKNAEDVKIKMEEKIKFFLLPSKVFLAVQALLAYSARSVCVVAFFVPFLGLLDVLVHWKAEQMNKDSNDRSHYKKYTGVSLGVGFGFFMLGLFIQTGIALLVKLAINKEFRNTSFGSKLQHISLTINLPDNFGDWTSGGGDLDDLTRRQRMHLLERCILILLQFISFWVTGGSFKTLTKTHQIVLSLQ